MAESPIESQSSPAPGRDREHVLTDTCRFSDRPQRLTRSRVSGARPNWSVQKSTGRPAGERKHDASVTQMATKPSLDREVEYHHPCSEASIRGRRSSSIRSCMGKYLTSATDPSRTILPQLRPGTEAARPVALTTKRASTLILLA